MKYRLRSTPRIMEHRHARLMRRQGMAVPNVRLRRSSRFVTQQVTCVTFEFRAGVELAHSATQVYDVLHFCNGHGLVQVTAMDASAFKGVAFFTETRLRQVGYGKIKVTDAAVTALMARMVGNGIRCITIPGLLSYRPMSEVERDGRDDPIIFFNSSLALSPTHYDPLDAVLIVLAGSKTVHIAPPRVSQGVSLTGTHMNAFEKKADDPYEGTPPHAKLWFQFELKAGDGVFIPAGMP
jgi:hypothetical protein